MSTVRNRPTNVPSLILKENENEALFQTIGRLCVTLATGVVQLYLADQPDRNRWSKRCCGVACFIKDSSKRSFYIRVYDIKKQQMIWEQEIYNQFVYKTPREYFHTFEADNCQAGMNFASEDEAKKFKRAVEDKLNERLKKRQGRRRTVQQKPPSNRPPAAAPQTMGGSTPSINSTVELSRNNNSSSTATLKKEKDKKKDGKKKLTKADIGTPSDFRHVSHVGWDPHTGFDMNNLEPDMQMLFQSVGISADDNVDRETIDFIYDFVEKHGGIDAVKKEFDKGKAPPPPPPAHRPAAGAPPPPPPSRTPAAPPPPPSRAGMPPPAPSRGAPPPMRGTAPPPPPSRAPAAPRAPAAVPPPPPSAAPPPPPSSGPPPPPPPPPVPAGGPPAPPPPPPMMPGGGDNEGRGALMDAIRHGTQLKPTSPTGNDAPKEVDSRDQLLNAIRQGANLKKVENDDRPISGATVDADGLVGALAKALASRRPAYVESDDEDDGDDDDDDASDDDEWDD